MGCGRMVVALGLGLVIIICGVSRGEGFRCSSEGKRCGALVDYKSPNRTTLSHIQSLFNVSQLVQLVGANALPATTPGNHTVGEGDIIKIPFPCKCSNATGLSDGLPVYVIKKDDTLYHIAAEIFSGLVTYPQIQQLNNISDPTTIQPGQQVWIPLPCSCDDVNGTQVVHYGYRVPSGSSFQQIADQYGTTQDTLLFLNNVTDPKSLLADQIIDVPLRACWSSAVKNESLDFPLLVANGTNVYTANGCVKCSCDSANATTTTSLQCEASQLKPYTNWVTCPATKCGDWMIGNTTSTASCTRTICAYAGYDNQTISTTLFNLTTCPAPPPASAASRITLQTCAWNHLFIPIHIILFYHLYHYLF